MNWPAWTPYAIAAATLIVVVFVSSCRASQLNVAVASLNTTARAGDAAISRIEAAYTDDLRTLAECGDCDYAEKSERFVAIQIKYTPMFAKYREFRKAWELAAEVVRLLQDAERRGEQVDPLEVSQLIQRAIKLGAELARFAEGLGV